MDAENYESQNNWMDEEAPLHFDEGGEDSEVELENNYFFGHAYDDEDYWYMENYY